MLHIIHSLYMHSVMVITNLFNCTLVICICITFVQGCSAHTGGIERRQQFAMVWAICFLPGFPFRCTLGPKDGKQKNGLFLCRTGMSYFADKCLIEQMIFDWIQGVKTAAELMRLKPRFAVIQGCTAILRRLCCRSKRMTGRFAGPNGTEETGA